MKRKYIALLGSIIVLSPLGVFVILMAAGRPGINEENFKLIGKGMSKKDVLRILGSPTAYRGGPEFIVASIGNPLDPSVYLRTDYERLNWHNGGCFIQLYFDEDEKVVAGSYAIIHSHAPVVRRNWLERLLDAVGF